MKTKAPEMERPAKTGGLGGFEAHDDMQTAIIGDFANRRLRREKNWGQPRAATRGAQAAEAARMYAHRVSPCAS